GKQTKPFEFEANYLNDIVAVFFVGQQILTKTTSSHLSTPTAEVQCTPSPIGFSQILQISSTPPVSFKPIASSHPGKLSSKLSLHFLEKIRVLLVI
ncbi:unnamed protein product, partial [Ilex paraguariensis]